MAWDESKHPRDRRGRFTDAYGSYRQNTSYSEILASEGSASRTDDYSEYPTVKLPRAEYAMVMHELATNLTDEEHKMPIVIKHICNSTYRIVVRGFGDYRIIGKTEIVCKKRRR